MRRYRCGSWYRASDAYNHWVRRARKLSAWTRGVKLYLRTFSTVDSIQSAVHVLNLVLNLDHFRSCLLIWIKGPQEGAQNTSYRSQTLCVLRVLSKHSDAWERTSGTTKQVYWNFEVRWSGVRGAAGCCIKSVTGVFCARAARALCMGFFNWYHLLMY